MMKWQYFNMPKTLIYSISKEHLDDQISNPLKNSKWEKDLVIKANVINPFAWIQAKRNDYKLEFIPHEISSMEYSQCLLLQKDIAKYNEDSEAEHIESIFKLSDEYPNHLIEILFSLYFEKADKFLGMFNDHYWWDSVEIMNSDEIIGLSSEKYPIAYRILDP